MSGGGITPAERGTATHKAMQFFDFEKSGDIVGEIHRLYEWQFLSEREAKSIHIEGLRRFFESDVFARITRAGEVHRELRFLTELPAGQIDPSLKDGLADEKVVVQGAVDLCFVEGDSVTVLDFKTDHVTSPEELAAAYGGQLGVYALACEKIFGKPVKQMIYSFCLHREIML